MLAAVLVVLVATLGAKGNGCPPNLPQGAIHLGGELALPIPTTANEDLEVADESGTVPTDGSLGTATKGADGHWHYAAPLVMPKGALAIIQTKQTQTPAYQVRLTEGRAAYIRPFDVLADEPGGAPGLPALGATERESATTGRQRIAQELDRAKAAGLNIVLVEAYYHGYTLWPTQVGRQRPSSIGGGVAVYDAGGVVGGQLAQTWDPVRAYLTEAHSRDIEVHLWLEVFYAWTRHLQSGPVGTPTGSSWLWAKHPDWFNMKRKLPGVNPGGEVVSVAEDGKYFLDPRHPLVTAYLYGLVEEIYNRYPDVDGVHLDYVRYPKHTSGSAPSWYGAGKYYDAFGFNPATFSQFETQTGISAAMLDPTNVSGAAWQTFTQWKTQAVTDVVASIHALTQQLAPQVVLSASVFPVADSALKMQDPLAWGKQQLVDILLPQLYYTSVQAMEAAGDPFVNALHDKVGIYPIFYVPHLFDLKSGSLKAGGDQYLSYAARRGLPGTALFILTGKTTGISSAMAALLTGAGGRYEHPAEP
jgi:uncharacterized lipoprotein YddW (UPF0748 family)